jgi:hypothetical protein
LIYAFLTEAPDVFEDKWRKISEPLDVSMVAKAGDFTASSNRRSG